MVAQIDHKIVKRYLQTRKVYLMIIFTCEGKQFNNRMQKTRTIKKTIEVLKEDFGIELRQLIENVYITAKRYAISKLLKTVKFIENSCGKCKYYIVRNITKAISRTLILDEEWKKVLQSIETSIRRTLIKKLANILGEETTKEIVWKSPDTIMKILKEVGIEKISEDILSDIKLIKLIKSKINEIKEKKELIVKSKRSIKISEKGELRKTKTYRFVLVIKGAKENVDKRTKYKIVQKLVKELKEKGIELEHVYQNVYVSKTKHNLVKLLEVQGIVSKYPLDIAVYAGLKLSLKLIQFVEEPITEKPVEKKVVEKEIPNEVIELAEKVLKTLEEKPSLRKAISYRVNGTNKSMLKALEEILKYLTEQ